MDRRRYLRLTSVAGVGATAGCFGLLSNPCGPADDALGDVSIDPGDYSLEDEYDHLSDREFSVRGTVFHEPVRGVLVDDGTGAAGLTARRSDLAIDQEVVEAGDCATATGVLNLEQSTTHEMPEFEVTEFGVSGASDADVTPTEEYPVPRFDVEYDREADESRFLLVGGDPVVARNLVVRWRADGDETPWTQCARAPWHELADVGADETVPEKSTVSFDGRGIEVSMLWRSPDRRWSREVKSLGVSG